MDDRLICGVDFANAKADIGKTALRTLSHIQTWLEYGPSPGKWKLATQRNRIRRQFGAWLENCLGWMCKRQRRHVEGRRNFRLAASVVARSEAELYGLSSPRFALRADIGRMGFVNIRRLQLFAERFECRFPGQGNNHKLRQNILKSICIADSLIVRPKWCSEYHVLGSGLDGLYGEEFGDVESTPFMQHTPIGGGMCAQAVCFMSMVCYAQTANFIPCVAEITHSHQQATGEMALGGMKVNEVVRFFNEYRRERPCMESGEPIGLRASLGFVSAHPDKLAEARVALSSYLESRVPIVLPVDLYRMWGRLPGKKKTRIGESLLLGNRVPIVPKMPECIRESGHMVLLVGSKPDTGSNEEKQFLVNDPASLPFIPASLGDLFEVRQYRPGCGPANLAWQSPMMPIPITPSKVKMQLLQTAPDKPRFLEDDTSWMREGLIDIAKMVNHVNAADPDMRHLPSYGDDSWPGQFRLVDFAGDADSIEKQLAGFPCHGVRALRHLATDGRLHAQWYWIQYISPKDKSRDPSSLWVWDAQQEPSVLAGLSSQKSRDCLKYVLKGDAGEWDVCFSTGAGSADQSKRATDSHVGVPSDTSRMTDGLACSLISSFASEGVVLSEAGRKASKECAGFVKSSVVSDEPASKLPLELYVFMEPEIQAWKKCLDLKYMPDDAVGFLAELTDEAATRITRHLSTSLEKMHCDVIALASFIPEISCPDPIRERGVNAVVRLVKMAHTLQTLGHCVSVVELVAGSRITGCIDSVSNEESDLSVSFHPPEAAADILLSSLKDIVLSFDSMKVRLALELEPGPFFVLGNHKSLVSVAELIAKPDNWMNGNDDVSVGKKRSTQVGFNLDIGHWNIAGIDPDWVRYDDAAKLVRNRIIHAHLSGHHKTAHFGDIPLENSYGECTISPKDVHPWIDLLREINSEASRELPFSGYVSLELEAAKHHHQVTCSFSRLCKI
jgi:sugar phosphate isomerase/epimerase